MSITFISKSAVAEDHRIPKLKTPKLPTIDLELPDVSQDIYKATMLGFKDPIPNPPVNLTESTLSGYLGRLYNWRRKLIVLDAEHSRKPKEQQRARTIFA